MENLILLSDAYKYSHHKFYNPGTTNIYSYLESRGGLFEETVFYGLQYFLKEYLAKPITQEDLEEATDVLSGVFSRDDVFSPEKFQYIIDNHNGYFPVRIKAVPEGTVVPVKNVLMTIENTDPNCAWVTNFLETLLLQVWYPITVATLSREVKKLAKEYLIKTTGNADGLPFFLSDFGFRGVSSVESAKLGGSAHLVNFLGSDTIAGTMMIKKYYNSKLSGISIPATEHSICTQEGEEGEIDVFKRVLKTFPTGLIACVSDSFNIFRACEEYWGTELKDKILEREGTLVIRPDSGDPIQTLLKIFEILFDKFGYTTTPQGYRELPPQIRVIQGDGINLNSIKEILEALTNAGIATSNYVLGMGGKLLQGVNRDTQNFAFKCSSTVINGEERNVVKTPTEMDENGNIQKSFKTSKKGRLKLVETMNGLVTLTSLEPGYDDANDLLVEVYNNGKLTQDYTFESIRERAEV